LIFDTVLASRVPIWTSRALMWRVSAKLARKRLSRLARVADRRALAHVRFSLSCCWRPVVSRFWQCSSLVTDGLRLERACGARFRRALTSVVFVVDRTSWPWRVLRAPCGVVGTPATFPPVFVGVSRQGWLTWAPDLGRCAGGQPRRDFAPGWAAWSGARWSHCLNGSVS